MYIKESLMVPVESLWNEFQFNPRQTRLMVPEGLIAYIRHESFTPFNIIFDLLAKQ
jgi:hypothetical protein